MTATTTNPATASVAMDTPAPETSPIPGAPPSFNALLAKLHGPTSCLASSMSQLVPFPAIDALPDATVLDLHLSLSHQEDGSVALHAKTRYETAATASEATTFYQLQLNAASDDVTSIVGAPDGAESHFDAKVGSGRYCARIFDLGRTRTVMVQTESTQLLDNVPFDDLAGWHGLGHPTGSLIKRAEVFTVAAGTCAPVQAIYSTEYLLPGVSPSELRSMTDSLLEAQGWSATETFEDSLVFDGSFAGEAHIAGTADAAQLTLVGEFEVR